MASRAKHIFPSHQSFLCESILGGTHVSLVRLPGGKSFGFEKKSYSERLCQQKLFLPIIGMLEFPFAGRVVVTKESKELAGPDVRDTKTEAELRPAVRSTLRIEWKSRCPTESGHRAHRKDQASGTW